MSSVNAPPVPQQTEQPVTVPNRPFRRRLRQLLLVALAVFTLLAIGYWGVTIYRKLNASTGEQVPVARVERGDLTFTVTARGELRGGNPESIIAPMIGGSELHITALKRTGSEVKPGDVVVQFDTGEQQYKLKEADADLAEAEQKIVQAKAQRDAQNEEDRYALIKAQNDLKLAELEARKNPLLATITAKQNDLAVASAQEHLNQVQQNLKNRKTTLDAGIAKEQAGRAKADAQAATARQNIEAMTIRAHRAGYVSVKQNTATNIGYMGMVLPLLQVGDSVRPGMAVAEIPDLKNWEVRATVGELDRGHLAVNDKVDINVVAVPGHVFRGHVKELGGMTGMFWDRHFECTIALDDSSSALRPGMSATSVITTDRMQKVLSVPSQALFDADGHTFVYLKSGSGFARHDVKLVRRNDARAVISDLSEGQTVALANPLETQKKASVEASPLKTVAK